MVWERARYALVMVGALMCFSTVFQGQSLAGKKDNSLNIAWEKELETLDLYYNTAREGIIVSYLIYDTLFIEIPRPRSICPPWPQATNG